MQQQSNMFGAILLVAGTCIGAGMLGLPVATAAAGFFPTLGAFLLVWFFMNTSALAYLEVTLHFTTEVNLITLTRDTLGRGAMYLAWILYTLFLYSLMAAYTAGGASISMQTLNVVPDSRLELGLLSTVFMAPLALVVYFGAAWVDRINRVLMFGLIFSFVYLCFMFMHAHPEHKFPAWEQSKYLWFTLPLLVTSFGYHTLIPSLKTYLHGSVKRLVKAMVIGSLIPFIVYALWELIILYLVPTYGDRGLISMLHSKVNPGEAVTAMLGIHGNLIQTVTALFAFFTLTSSIIGVGLGMFDFFSDGLRIRKTKIGRVILSLLTFGPPLAFTIVMPDGFLFALNYAGVFAAILLIIYPVLMAWHARYIKKLPGTYQMFGGKAMLVLTLLFGIFVIFSDILIRQGLYPVPVP